MKYNEFEIKRKLEFVKISPRGGTLRAGPSVAKPLCGDPARGGPNMSVGPKTSTWTPGLSLFAKVSVIPEAVPGTDFLTFFTVS